MAYFPSSLEPVALNVAGIPTTCRLADSDHDFAVIEVHWDDDEGPTVLHMLPCNPAAFFKGPPLPPVVFAAVKAYYESLS